MFHFFKKSPKYESRADGINPYILLMHYTGMESGQAAIDRLTDPESGVNVHYIVEENGKIHESVPENKRAWHAGVSFWQGEEDINSASIGIEVVNPGHEFGYVGFPQDQMDAVLKLSQDIQKRHDIHFVLGHSDVAPERKQDPGERFDWEFLAKNGIGDWPLPMPEDYKAAEVAAVNDFEAEKLFNELGYNPMAAFQDIVTAFQRHYYPSAFQNDTQGQIDQETIARLIALINKNVI